MADMILNWGLFGNYNTEIASGAAVDVGGISVTVSQSAAAETAGIFIRDAPEYVAPGETFNPESALKIYGFGGSGSVGESSTTTLSFASTDDQWSDQVSDVSFRINDIDTGSGGNTHVDIVTVRAYDLDGNEVPVSMTTSGTVGIAGGTATAGDGFGSEWTPANAEGSVLVNIAGPVARIEIEFNNGDTEDQDVWVTDVHFSTTDAVIPCFTPGTAIATARGERFVEDLRVGDRVITRDNGIQKIRWIGKRRLEGAALQQHPHLNPVLIRQGALGNDLPERDMLVSPNHRVLIVSEDSSLYFGENEVLVAAKHLTWMEGIDVTEATQVTYIHLLFDQHEMVLSNGTWTESFQPADQTLRGMKSEQRDEILELFPELVTAGGADAYQSARRSLKKHEARLLVR